MLARTIGVLMITALGLAVVFSTALADPVNVGGFLINDTAGSDTQPPIKDILDRVTNFMLGALLSVAVIMAIYAGYIYLQAAGNPAKLKEASQMLVWAGVAAGVGLLSKGIINLALTILGSTTKI